MRLFEFALQNLRSRALLTGTDTRWAMYVAVFLVLLGLVVLLAYYLLPQNAFQRSFWSAAAARANRSL